MLRLERAEEPGEAPGSVPVPSTASPTINLGCLGTLCMAALATGTAQLVASRLSPGRAWAGCWGLGRGVEQPPALPRGRAGLGFPCPVFLSFVPPFFLMYNITLYINFFFSFPLAQPPCSLPAPLCLFLPGLPAQPTPRRVTAGCSPHPALAGGMCRSLTVKREWVGSPPALTFHAFCAPSQLQKRSQAQAKELELLLLPGSSSLAPGLPPPALAPQPARGSSHSHCCHLVRDSARLSLALCSTLGRPDSAGLTTGPWLCCMNLP